MRYIKFFTLFLFSLSLAAQGDLYRDWSTQGARRTHEVRTAGSRVKLDGGFFANNNLGEGVNYYIIYDNKGAKELIYTPEIIGLKKLPKGHSMTFDVAATQMSLLNTICTITGKREDQVQPYAAGMIIVTNGVVSEINNWTPLFAGGRDQKHLDAAVEDLKVLGLKLETNTKIVNYTKEDLGKDLSLNRAVNRWTLYNEENGEKDLSKMEKLYAELAKKFPDKSTPGFVDVEKLSELGLYDLTEFFAVAQDDAYGLASATYIYTRSSTALDAVINEGKSALEGRTIPDKDRKEVILDVFDKAVQKEGETPSAVLSILQNKKIVPDKGTILVLGSGVDFYEWLVPILKRNDVNVIVVEKADASAWNKNTVNILYGALISSPEKVYSYFAEQVWKELKDNNPELMTSSLIGSRQELTAAMLKQVKFLSASKCEKEKLDADLIISRLPWRYDIYGNLKKDGFAWVVTERELDIDNPQKSLFPDPAILNTEKYDVVKLPDNDVSMFLPSDPHANSMPGRFLAFNVQDQDNKTERPLLFIPKTANTVDKDTKKGKYEDLYIPLNPEVVAIKGEYASAGEIFNSSETGKIKLPELPYGGKVLYVIYEDSEGKLKVAYSSEVPDLTVDLSNTDAEILVTHRSLYSKILLTEGSISGVVVSGELIYMPNGEIAAITNRSNTFRGKQTNLDFAVEFFKGQGLEISPPRTLIGNWENKRSQEHLSSLENAKMIIKVAQNPTMYKYYKDLLDVQKKLATLSPSSERAGAMLDQEKMEEFIEKMGFAAGLLADMESFLAAGEGISQKIYKWMTNNAGTFPYEEPLKQLTEYANKLQKIESGSMLKTTVTTSTDDKTATADEYDVKNVAAAKDIMTSMAMPTKEQVADVEAYVTYLVKDGKSHIKELDYAIKWLYVSYTNLGIQDKEPLLTISKDFLDLKSKTTTGLYTFNSKVNYKAMSLGMRDYLKFKTINVKDINYEADVKFLFPLALQELAKNINKRFDDGEAVDKLVTEQECKVFTPIWALMVSDLYGVMNSKDQTGTDKLAPKFLAVKDLSELLKSSAISYSSSYFQTYAEADYMMKDAVKKAEAEGILDEFKMDGYNKDVDMKTRALRLEKSSVGCY